MVKYFNINVSVACKNVGFSKSTYYYKPKLKDDTEVIDVLNNLVDKYPRNGFFLLYHRIRKLGYEWNHNRPHSILNKLSPIEYLEQYNFNANYSGLSCPN
jgi:transposase InsO family protein